MALEVSLKKDLCIGTGNCVFWAPEAFELSESGVVKIGNIEGLDEERIVHAAFQCPIRAIAVSRDGVNLV